MEFIGTGIGIPSAGLVHLSVLLRNTEEMEGKIIWSNIGYINHNVWMDDLRESVARGWFAEVKIVNDSLVLADLYAFTIANRLRKPFAVADDSELNFSLRRVQSKDRRTKGAYSFRVCRFADFGFLAEIDGRVSGARDDRDDRRRNACKGNCGDDDAGELDDEDHC